MRRQLAVNASNGPTASGTKAAVFSHQRSRYCASGALRDLLEHNGLDHGEGPLAEGVVFGLGGGLGFQYLELPENSKPVVLVGQTSDLETRFAINLRIDLDVHAPESPSDAWRSVKRELTAGRPTMVGADIMYLEYRHAQEHARHNIVIVDHDESTDLVWIADPDRDELQQCSPRSLASALNSEVFRNANHGAIYRYAWPKVLPTVRQSVVAGIRCAVDNMREGRISFPTQGESGLRGIDRFAAAYRSRTLILSQPLEAVSREIDGAFAGIQGFVNSAGTGCSISRALQSRFLLDIAKILHDRELRAMSCLYYTLAHAWAALATFETHDQMETGAMAINSIAAMEHRGVEMMEEWLLRQD